MAKSRVRFLPDNREVFVDAGENLLKAAMMAGVHINASCGGSGVCGRCKVKIENGNVIGEQDEAGYWQACKTFVHGDVEVAIPVISYLDRGALARKAPSAGISLARDAAREGLLVSRPFSTVVQKKFLQLSPPSSRDNINDLSRLKRGLRVGFGLGALEIDPSLITRLPHTVRAQNWSVTATLRYDPPRPALIMDLEAGDTRARAYAVAADIGTTTLCIYLVDLNSGEVVAEASDYNPQISFGEDVISRIVFSQRGGGLKILQAKVAEKLNQLIQEVVDKAGVSRENIYYISAAGNTTMSHLLLGLDPKYLREAPYTPVVRSYPRLRAEKIGLDVPPFTYLDVFPSVASYVGGDIVAGVIASRIFERPELTLYIDIGTNGEIVLGNREWLVCASCSAGPAFEGGGIRHGLRAMPGAIEAVHVNPETCEPMIITIGMTKPKGICGSGLISLVASLMEGCIIDQQGKFNRDLCAGRIREGHDGYEYVIVYGENTATGEDIVLTEVDIENLIRAKGAMFAGYLTLTEAVGLTVPDIERVLIAGAFGSFLDIEQAITIGLLPDLPRDCFYFVGNGSLLGAKAAVCSVGLMEEREKVANMMTNFELSENPRFMEHYISSLFLPHTDRQLFPTVWNRINCWGAQNG
ncbi:MAG: ASKHA domain-containing protein [Thermodesulfobacteriota bacterium]